MRHLFPAAALVFLLFPQSALAQDPPAAAPTPAPAPKGVIAETRAAMAEKDFPRAEKIVLSALAGDGTTPETIEALSWLGRGALAEKMYDQAQSYAVRAYAMVEEQLMTRKLDDETHLPLALGASIEVQALVMAADGNRSEGVLFLRRELEKYKDTSIVMRTQKNINLLSLEGQPAFPIEGAEWLGTKPPTLAELKGKPVIVYLWAHWCPDCKIQGPILETLLNKYRSTGLTVVAPTQRYGYVAQRKTAPPDEELAYITKIRDEVYPWLKNYPVPVSPDAFIQYGVSTTPTLVLIDRAGNVVRYNPGRMTVEALDEALKPILAPVSSAKK
jgi:thiol-disulfide isomerase/thioredoxin